MLFEMATQSEGHGAIEGLDELKKPNSSFTLNRRPRPPPIDIYAHNEERRLPPQNAPIHRQQSKGGIRGIFNRNKADKSVLSPTEEDAEVKVLPIRPEVQQRKKAAPVDSVISSITPATSTVKTSRLNLRNKSTKETPAKPAPKSTTKYSPGRPSTVWDPPPLFQAYPQSIKHAHLSASTLSADTILRMHNHKRKNSLTETPGIATEDTAKAAEKGRSKHKRQLSGSLSKAEWTQKIFVLVTSGYLLQYAGDGSFDRLPEKMMQLGKDSVAFVSDVIPGKHWVLQISQSMDIDGTPIADSRSLLSRLTFRGGSDYRRTATSMLLVLDSVVDMESWLTVFRREIESLGGKKHVPDISRQKSEEHVPKLVKQPSHRYLVAKNPDHFSAPISPSALGIAPAVPWSRTNSLKQGGEDASSVQEIPQRPSLHQQSATNSFVSHDGQSLDELRDHKRFSYMSSGQRTSTQYSSPEPSPTRDNSFQSFRESVTTVSQDAAVVSRPNAAAINERRRSMQAMPIVTYDQPVSKMQRHSTYGPPSVTPNFSVPNSSSRRYSTTKSYGTSPSQIQPAITTKASEPLLRGARKTPPPAIAIARPLSTVVDDASPLQPLSRTPSSQTENSAPSLHQITASIVDIAPRSPLPESTPVRSMHQSAEAYTPHAHSRSVREAGTSHLNFEFPRRPTSMYHSQSYDVPSPKETIVTAPNKRHSLASPERLNHLPQQNTTFQSQANGITSPVAANTSKPLSKRPISFSPSSSSPDLTFSQRPALSAFPFPSTTSQPPKVRTSPPRQKKHHPQVSDLPDLPTIIGSRPKASNLQRFKGLESGSNGNTLGGEVINSAFGAVNGTKRMTVGNRRSMPFLVGGPPPAPPPDCALPALPPPGKRLSMKA